MTTTTMTTTARTLALALLLCSLAPALTPRLADAGSYCFQRGKHTYCDDGRSYHRYGNNIVSGDGRRWHTFGSHTYGKDGTWIARHGKGRYTGGYAADPGDESAILPRILDRQAEDDDAGQDEDGSDD